jgi:hypothetical protein
MTKKAVFIVVAEYDGPITVERSGMDDDADSYMDELFNDAVRTTAEMQRMDGALISAPDDLTLEKARALLTGVSD